MPNVTIGVNILEILTTGMYRDSRVIFREYIQNACDQINTAVKIGLFKSAEEGEVELWIDERTRSVSIEDNATGIPAAQFREMLYSIGEKWQGQHGQQPLSHPALRSGADGARTFRGVSR